MLIASTALVIVAFIAIALFVKFEHKLRSRGDCHVNLAPGPNKSFPKGSAPVQAAVAACQFWKCFAPESALERIAGNEMALDVERVLDCGMNGQEPLR